MKNISEVISVMNIDDLKNSQFSYSDILSIGQSDIDNNNLNYWRWKYYTGDITIDEHNNIKETIKEYMIYNVYTIIFRINQSQNWYEDISLNCFTNQDYDNFSNEVTDLWLMRPEKFQYEEEFKKLIFMLYLVKKEEIFRQIALDFYNINEDASKYIEQCDSYKPMFLIHRKGDCDYKNNYAIKEYKANERNCSPDDSTNENDNKENKDWIIKRFGGAQ
ncbi:hypothetical protein [Clostridium botulinum]|uniref:Uncharacterized protein n=1 Tax=Clostridium botulinum TaxID=1491 RepID=A0A0M1M2I9_CLOBO|nr:hypothetical protein [Clostridium botulinum]KOR64102.1 hypothetical protein ADT22_01655 [Clostridium botulinum]MCS6112540.1 hypothetical protein [Clostridium botulinum]NFF88721.1 hypothetical protein [Clostridium botulinum]NFG11205.1 hypothetical protein [Clostridium botulinum]NFL43397.1 hypothetical protein [Clostridium botulinum]